MTILNYSKLVGTWPQKLILVCKTLTNTAQDFFKLYAPKQNFSRRRQPTSNQELPTLGVVILYLNRGFRFIYCWLSEIDQLNLYKRANLVGSKVIWRKK